MRPCAPPNDEIAAILDTRSRLVAQPLERVSAKLGGEGRTAAVAAAIGTA